MSKRVGIIGCGVIAPNHLLPLKEFEETEIIAVCDIKADRANKYASEYNCKAYTDYKEMIEKENLDSVHVCLPHYLHCEVTVYALSNGVDVLCEKPMAIHYSEAIKMKETAEKYNRKLGIIFQNRYNDGARFAKKLIKKGKLGKVTCVYADVIWGRDQAYYDSDAWRGKWKTEGGGVLINQAIHTLDLLRYLVDSEVVSVESSVSHKGPTNIEVEDTAEGLIKFENGARGIFYFTNNFLGNISPRLNVEGEKGRIEIRGASAKVYYNDGTVEYSRTNKNAKVIGKACYGLGHFKQIEDFYSETPKIDMLGEAIKTQKLLEEIYKSAGIERK